MKRTSEINKIIQFEMEIRGEYFKSKCRYRDIICFHRTQYDNTKCRPARIADHFIRLRSFHTLSANNWKILLVGDGRAWSIEIIISLSNGFSGQNEFLWFRKILINNYEYVGWKKLKIITDDIQNISWEVFIIFYLIIYNGCLVNAFFFIGRFWNEFS